MKSEVLKILQKYQTFLISTHVNPDPDALSSQLAMALFLKARGKKVLCLNEEKVPARYKFLPHVTWIKKNDLKKKVAYDVAIVVDCGDFERIGTVRNTLDPQKPVINIDHHITNDFFGTANCVDAQASSTAEIIYEILAQGGFKFTKDIATLLYLGIMTDTGSFRYENTTSRSHRIAAELLKFKIPVNALYQRLYETIPLSDLQFFSKVVGKFESHFGGQILCMELRRNLLKKFSEEFDVRDMVFRYLRLIKGVEMIVLLSEQSSGKTRLNFRSQGSMDVAKLAARFGGGGHYRASGCLMDLPISAAKRQILKQIKKDIFKKS